MTPHRRFESLALTLPPAPNPVGVYKPCLVVGQHLYVSGRFADLTERAGRLVAILAEI